MEANKENGKKFKIGRFGYQVIINLCIIIGLGFLLIWIALIWLDSWTNHGHYEIVPEVKGLSYADASQRLTAEGFKFELSDSVYDTSSRPGTVLDQSPKKGTKAKEGRLVYLTINAFSPKSVTIPNLMDMSLRQARSVLEGLGIKKINVVSVPSEFKDLVLAVKSGNKRISAGARIPVTSSITIEVGMGEQHTEYSDSVSNEGVNVERLDLE